MSDICCKICGKVFHFYLNGAHLKSHGLNSKTYYEQFPNEPRGTAPQFDKWRNSEKNKNHLRNQNKIIIETEKINPHIKNARITKIKKAYDEGNAKINLSKAMKNWAKTPRASAHLSNKTITDRMRMSNYDRWLLDFGKNEADFRLKNWQNNNILPNSCKNTSIENILRDAFVEIGINFQQQYEISPYYCDFFLQDFNLIFEAYGNYWHANPDKFKADDFIGHKGHTAAKIWEFDKIRSEKIKQHGFNFEFLWETQIKQNHSLIDDLIKILKRYN